MEKERYEQLEPGDVVRFTMNDITYVRRFKRHDYDHRGAWVYDAQSDESEYEMFVTRETLEDKLVKAGEKVRSVRSGEILIADKDVYDESETPIAGRMTFTDYEGRMNWYIVDDTEMKEEKTDLVIPDESTEKIVEDVCSVLTAANYEHHKEHVLTMIDEWRRNKNALIELLRKHPNWSEKDKCVTGFVNEVRKKEDNKFLAACKEFYGNCRANGMYLTDAQLDIMWDGVQCTAPEKFVTEEIRRRYADLGVEMKVGEKYSRVLNRIFIAMGLDKYPNYNKDFAKISDAINPIDNKQKGVLSVHPCDFLKMSWGEKWNSCHDIRNRGCYHAGTQSYMMDSVSAIFYTISNDGDKTPWKNNKLTRQIFCYKDGVLLQSRCYPDYNMEDRNDEYLRFVKSVFETCLGLDNEKWILHKSDRMCYLDTLSGSTHYPDYNYDQYNTRVSVMSEVDSPAQMIIGHKSINLVNGVYHSNHTQINNGNTDRNASVEQNTYYICAYCGEIFYQGSRSDYTGYDGQDFYCDYHYRTCYHCGETYYGYSAEEEGIWLNDEWYCDYCERNHLVRCDRCDCLYDPSEEGDEDRGGHYCQNCIDEMYVCEDCGCYIDGDDVRLDDGGYPYCEDCYDRNFFHCEECDEETPISDRNEHEGCYYCSNCFERITIPERSEPNSDENHFRITDSGMILTNPQTAFTMGYTADMFQTGGVAEHTTGTKVHEYEISGRKVYILKVTDKYVAIFSDGVEEI